MSVDIEDLMINTYGRERKGIKQLLFEIRKFISGITFRNIHLQHLV